MTQFQVRHSRVDAKNAKNDEKRSAILKSLKELAAKLQSIESTDEKDIRQIDQVIFFESLITSTMPLICLMKFYFKRII